MFTLSYVMLATLGGQPQVVTFALDDLLRRGFAIRRVLVLHLMPPEAAPRIQRAMEKLTAEFSTPTYAGHPCRLEFLPVRSAGQRLDDIRDAATANAAWSSIYTQIAGLKAQGLHLHVCISGGRRMLALLAMSAAMLHFDHDDCLWHMYTPQPFLERAHDGAVMHAQPADGVHLIQVPLAPWGAYFPGLRALAQIPPAEEIVAQTRQLESTERHRCQTVVKHLTPRQLDTLRAFATGKNPQEVAESLYVTVKTIHAHKTVILAECRNSWQLPEDEWLTYHFLYEKFNRYWQHEL
ncbi:MAG: CRISPR-associated ring nuclease [Chloroflexota bacterium]|nr:CRISPR-associated ring nuclease [Chloroflexota bacterium]